MEKFNPEQRRRLMELAGISELQMTDDAGETTHGKELWQILPDILYHATKPDTWSQIQGIGYLGYKYSSVPGQTTSNWIGGDHNYYSDNRHWQKPGWGVYFATTPDQASGHIGDDNYFGEMTILSVNKTDLDPELCYIDGTDTPDSPEDNDLEYLRSKYWKIFYAGKIPLEKVHVYSGEEIDSRETLENLNILKKTARKAEQLFKNVPNLQLTGGCVEEDDDGYLCYEVLYKIGGVPGVKMISYVNENEPGMGSWTHDIMFYGTNSKYGSPDGTDNLRKRLGLPELEFPYGYFYRSVRYCPKINVPAEKLQ